MLYSYITLNEIICQYELLSDMPISEAQNNLSIRRVCCCLQFGVILYYIHLFLQF